MAPDSSPVCLALDLGTTRLKVALVDATGTVRALASRTIHTAYSGSGAQQDPNEWWAQIVAATREVVNASPDVGRAVQLVTCTSQYMSLVPVDGRGLPVGPALMWMDQRGAAASEHLRTRELQAIWQDRHGLAPFGSDDLAHLAYFRSALADVYAKAAFFVEPADALTARLVGHVTTNQNTAFPMLLTDNRSLGCFGFDPLLVELSGIESRLLAPMVPVGSLLGQMRASVATELGLEHQPMVIAGTIDSATSAIGTSAVGPDRCGVVIGTTSVVVAHTSKLASDTRRSLMTAPSGLADRYVLLAENGAGGRAVEQIAQLLNRTSAELIALAAQAAPGAGGVRFQPWLVGSMAPRPNHLARASMTGLGLATGPADLARAALEGVAYNLAWLMPEVEAFVGNTFSTLCFGGGAAQSPLWAQILADACQRPVARVAEPSATNARGAALLAFSHAGLIAQDGLGQLVPIAQLHEPDCSRSDESRVAVDLLALAHRSSALRASGK